MNLLTISLLIWIPSLNLAYPNSFYPLLYSLMPFFFALVLFYLLAISVSFFIGKDCPSNTKIGVIPWSWRALTFLMQHIMTLFWSVKFLTSWSLFPWGRMLNQQRSYRQLGASLNYLLVLTSIGRQLPQSCPCMIECVSNTEVIWVQVINRRCPYLCLN